MRAEGLIEHHPEAWREATLHPFLDAVREGNLPAGAFEAWLVQDYLFVADLLTFQARLLARAPRPAQRVLASGLVAVEAELAWFEENAAERGLRLATERHPTTAEYHGFLERLEDEPYETGIVALWAMERAYLEAWSSARPGYTDYRPFVEHWTTPEFAGYVADLERAADLAMQSGDGEGQAASAFLEVARLERDFWAMAFLVEDDA